MNKLSHLGTSCAWVLFFNESLSLSFSKKKKEEEEEQIKLLKLFIHDTVLGQVSVTKWL